jgi:coenzyme F420-reducing hydrogenase delta subunit
MINMSAGMGERFAESASEFTEKIRGLGPSSVKGALKRKAACD